MHCRFIVNKPVQNDMKINNNWEGLLKMQLRRKFYNIYSKFPYRMKNKVSYAGKLLSPAIIFGRSYSKTIKLIQKTEFMCREALEKLQDECLAEILLHARLTTVYYREQMAWLGIDQSTILKNPKDAFNKIGFTDKSEMIKNFDKFLSDQKSSAYNDYVSTGGSSGEPFYFFINSDRSSKEWAYISDQWSRVGYTLRSRRVTFRGSRIEGADWNDDWITNERKFSSFNLTDEYLARIWPAFHEFKPEFVYAYPSTAVSICRYMERVGKQLPNTVKAWLLGSENIYDGQREYIEKVSGKRPFLWYGHSEKLVLAGECESSNYYHAYPQYGYVEFINENGKQAKPGEFAEIVGTGFINTVMPFIRYKTGDYCTYLGDHCPKCGRNYHIFENVRGRWTQEMLIGIGGNQICMSAINIHSNTMKNVHRFQFHQDQIGKATLKIVPKDRFNENDRLAIEDEFNQKFDDAVKVNAKVVNDIPLTMLGKWKFIDQKLDTGSVGLDED